MGSWLWVVGVVALIFVVVDRCRGLSVSTDGLDFNTTNRSDGGYGGGFKWTYLQRWGRWWLTRLGIPRWLQAAWSTQRCQGAAGTQDAVISGGSSAFPSCSIIMYSIERSES